jgi:hypothetical protein
MAKAVQAPRFLAMFLWIAYFLLRRVRWQSKSLAGHHLRRAVVPPTGFAGRERLRREVTVPSFCPRMVCTVCGAIGADARPNWNERAPASLYGFSRQRS